MSISVNVSVGRQGVVKLVKAILLYEGGQQGDAFATVHDVTGVDEGRPALAPGQLFTAEGLRDLHRSLYRQQKLAILPPHVLAVSPERLAWFEPARERVLFFSCSDAYLNGLSGGPFPQPPLLFIAGERSLRVFTLAGDERPTGSSPVFTAPYYNTSAGACVWAVRHCRAPCRRTIPKATPTRFFTAPSRTAPPSGSSRAGAARTGSSGSEPDKAGRSRCGTSSR